MRAIAATNRDLATMVEEGRFREDLYWRLNVLSLNICPLRERKEDIPLLVEHFLERYTTPLGIEQPNFSERAIELLMVYEWPGNVRELEYVVERSVVLSEHTVIRGTDIVLPVQRGTKQPESFKEAKATIITHFERSYIKGLLLAHQGNISKAARAAHKNRRAFWQLIRKHRIDVQSFKPG